MSVDNNSCNINEVQNVQLNQPIMVDDIPVSVNDKGEIVGLDGLVKPKIRKRTALVSEYINKFIREFLSTNEEELTRWNHIINQDKLATFINTNKIKMTNPNKSEETKKRKEEKKLKRIEKAKTIQQRKVEKAMARPKSAYYFFKIEEQEIIKQENPDFDKKQIHKELQGRWKTIKTTERGKQYKEIAEKVAAEKLQEEMNKPKQKYIPPEKTFTKLHHPDKEKRQEKNKDKYKPKPRSAFFYFKLEQHDIIKKENPKFNRKDINVELQNRWKVIKSTTKGAEYQKIAEQNVGTDIDKKKILYSSDVPRFTDYRKKIVEIK